MSQSEFEAITCDQCEAWENARVQVAIGFGIAFHWLRKWREFCWPITQQSNAKPKQNRNYHSTLKWKPLYNESQQK